MNNKIILALILVISLNNINFANPNILDYISMILLVASIILFFVDFFKKRK